MAAADSAEHADAILTRRKRGCSRSVALQNARAILHARERSEQELVRTTEASASGTRTARRRSWRASPTRSSRCDAEWRFTYLNRAGEEILRPLGKSGQDLIGKNLWQELPEMAVGTPLEENCRRAMREQGSLHFEMFYGPIAGLV